MIDRLDHLVLTVRDVDATCEFYARVLGIQPVTFGDNLRALVFGRQKINLHPADEPLVPHAVRPMPGSADLCFVADVPLAEVMERLERCRVKILEGPVERTGALGAMQSVYFRDPDGNLLEVSRYAERAAGAEGVDSFLEGV